MVTYVFGIIVMVHVNKRSKLILKYLVEDLTMIEKKIFFSFQISSILWSSDYKQIVTGQGHPNNHIHIWHYPSLQICHTLPGKWRIILTIV